MNKFFNPQSIAIIGASEDRKKVGGMILENVLEGGFSGKIFPINPRGGMIQGVPAFAQIAEIDSLIDLAVIAVPAEKVVEVVKECAERKKPIQQLIIVSAGFGESDDAGKAREKQLAELVQKNNLQIIGPNCLGIINPWNNLNASFAGATAEKGSVGLIMQSGAFVSAFLDWSKENRVGFSAIATIGNKTFLQETDFLEYFVQDKKTQVVGMYLEGFAQGKELCQKIRKISSQKPILILMAEGGEKTQLAAVSHTAALAGESAVARKALEKSGALVFSRPQDFWLALRFFSQFKLPLNKKVLLVTNAGGPAVVATGLLEKSSQAELFELTMEQKKALQEILPTSASVNNPIDLLGDADEERYQQVLEKIKNFSGLGAVVALLTRQKQTAVEKIAKVIESIQKEVVFPLLPVFMTNQKISDLSAKTFSFFEEALIGLEAAVSFRKIQKNISTDKLIIKEIDKKRSSLNKEIFQRVQAENRQGFYFTESVQFLRLYGLQTVSFESSLIGEKFLLKNLSFPVVLKIDDPTILHKDAHSGVILNIRNEEELQKQCQLLKARFSKSPLLVQSQQTIEEELILGIKNDSNFGRIVLCGLGGVATEFLGEKLLFFPEIENPNVFEELEKSLLGRVLKKKKISLEKVAEEIEKIILLAKENSWIKEMDINPLLVYRDQSFMVVDVKVII